MREWYSLFKNVKIVIDHLAGKKSTIRFGDGYTNRLYVTTVVRYIK